MFGSGLILWLSFINTTHVMQIFVEVGAEIDILTAFFSKCILCILSHILIVIKNNLLFL